MATACITLWFQQWWCKEIFFLRSTL